MAHKTLLCAAMAFTASCQPPLCVTKCGMQFNGVFEDSNPDRPEWSCGDLLYAERVLLDKLDDITNARENAGVKFDMRLGRMNACQQLGKWTLWLYKDPSWKDTYGISVAGQAYCHSDSKPIIVGYEPGVSIYRSSYPHEIVHAIQECWANPKNAENEDYNHANWVDVGIWEYIEFSNNIVR